MKKAKIIIALIVAAPLAAMFVRSELEAYEGFRNSKEPAQIAKRAKENYARYLSHENLTEYQNEVLADCMIEKLSSIGRGTMTIARSKRDAEIAMISGGRNPVDDDCLALATSTKD